MNVQPAEAQAVRRRGLGSFAAWPDELLAYFLVNARLSTRELLALSCTSKLMRLMVLEEPLWLQRHLDSCKRPFEYRVSRAGAAHALAGQGVGLECRAGAHGALPRALRWWCSAALSPR